METLREKAFHKYHCTIFQWIHEMSNNCTDVLKGNYDAEFFGGKMQVICAITLITLLRCLQGLIHTP